MPGGSTKEWKPKAVQGSGTAGASDAPTTIEATTSSLSVSNLDSDDATSKLHKKLQELHLQQRQHVILPNHIHVPESERSKLSFGSFGTLFGVNTSGPVVPEIEKSSTPMTETSQDIEENVEEESSRLVLDFLYFDLHFLGNSRVDYWMTRSTLISKKD